MIELLDHAFQVAHPVPVRIAERTRIDLIDDSAAQPIAHGRPRWLTLRRDARRGATSSPLAPALDPVVDLLLGHGPLHAVALQDAAQQFLASGARHGQVLFSDPAPAVL